MDSADLIDIVPMPTTVSNSSKPARPKSAVRRKTIDRDLDMIEGLDFTKDELEVDDNEEVSIFWNNAAISTRVFANDVIQAA